MTQGKEMPQGQVVDLKKRLHHLRAANKWNQYIIWQENFFAPMPSGRLKQLLEEYGRIHPEYSEVIKELI